MATNNRENSNFYEIGIPDTPGGGNVIDVSMSGNITVANVATFSNIANVRITGGGNNQYLMSNGNGTMKFDVATVAPSLPAGSNTWIQYNNNGAFGANTNFRYDKALNTMYTVNSNVTGTFTSNGTTTLSSNGNVIITGGNVGQALTTDGTGNLSWTTVSGSLPPLSVAVYQQKFDPAVPRWPQGSYSSLYFGSLATGYSAIPGLTLLPNKIEMRNDSGSVMFLYVTALIKISDLSGNPVPANAYVFAAINEAGPASYVAATSINLKENDSSPASATVSGIVKLVPSSTFGLRGYQTSGASRVYITTTTIHLLTN